MFFFFFRAGRHFALFPLKRTRCLVTSWPRKLCSLQHRRDKRGIVKLMTAPHSEQCFSEPSKPLRSVPRSLPRHDHHWPFPHLPTSARQPSSVSFWLGRLVSVRRTLIPRPAPPGQGGDLLGGKANRQNVGEGPKNIYPLHWTMPGRLMRKGPRIDSLALLQCTYTFPDSHAQVVTHASMQTHTYTQGECTHVG